MCEQDGRQFCGKGEAGALLYNNTKANYNNKLAEKVRPETKHENLLISRRKGAGCRCRCGSRRWQSTEKTEIT
jgi:hypothetical protein